MSISLVMTAGAGALRPGSPRPSDPAELPGPTARLLPFASGDHAPSLGLIQDSTDDALFRKIQLTMNETIAYLPGLSPVAGKELCARFDGGRLSSDGGVLLFPGIERRLRISDLLASCVKAAPFATATPLAPLPPGS